MWPAADGSQKSSEDALRKAGMSRDETDVGDWRKLPTVHGGGMIDKAVACGNSVDSKCA